jgi:N-acetylmuramoyl-L-alanine amidase
MRKLKILILAGHGGTDPGAEAGNVRESDINLAVSLLLGGMLTSEGSEVHFARTTDLSVSLDERVALEHRLRPDMTISLHCNSCSSPGPNGLEVFTSPGQTGADDLAEHVAMSLEFAFPDSAFRYDFADGDRDKEAKFRVLTGTIGPAVLIEMGFLSNPIELDWLCDRITQIRIASAVCAGVLGYAAERGAKP